jgi:uncharacterized OB-fold protein
VSYVGDATLGHSVFNADGTALVGSRCPECGDTRFPGRKLCVNDLQECEACEFSGLGTIYEAVRVELAPGGFDAPFWVGYIDLDEGARLFAQIRWSEESTPCHGDRVQMHVEPVALRDEPVLGPVFRKAV